MGFNYNICLIINEMVTDDCFVQLMRDRLVGGAILIIIGLIS